MSFFKRSLVFALNSPETVNKAVECGKDECVVGNNDLELRLEVLENNEIEVLYFEQVFSPTGTVTIPSGGTIQLDQFPGGADAFVNSISNGQPTGNFPKDNVGTIVDVQTFDSFGNYNLTGIPTSYPIGIIFIFKIAEVNKSNLNLTQVLEYWKIKSSEPYTKDFIIASTTWVVPHNLGYEPETQALLLTGEEIEGQLIHNSINQFTITFNVPTTGRVHYI